MASATQGQSELYSSTGKDDLKRRDSIAKTEKGRWERLWPVIACGAGLFSDGYLNNVRTHSDKSSNATKTNQSTITYPEDTYKTRY